ncbi:MAG: hypothetical protein LRY50_14125 [Geovibrio sp.]|nr:hypothetical protein [Geovibrio sp.]
MAIVLIVLFCLLVSSVFENSQTITPEQHALLKIISQDSNVPESIRDEIKNGDVSQNEYRDIIKKSYEHSIEVKTRYDELHRTISSVLFGVANIMTVISTVVLVMATPYVLTPFLIPPTTLMIIDIVLLMLMDIYLSDRIVLMLM